VSLSISLIFMQLLVAATVTNIATDLLLAFWQWELVGKLTSTQAIVAALEPPAAKKEGGERKKGVMAVSGPS
jgi:hypothetical protein